MEQFSGPCITARQSRRKLIVSVFPARVLTAISYAAVWRKDQEEGAVQRLLDVKRIADLKRFVLAGGDYPACIILNWVSTEHLLTVENGMLSFSVLPRLAQLVDGQHRVEGLREAMKTNETLGTLEIPVAIYNGLKTPECADIFLSINDKQKPVPRSMVVDLYGVASDQVVDPVSERARDLAELLNNEEDSPYHSLIRFANEPRSKFGIAVSTVVDHIKPLVEPQGLLPQVGIDELNMQKEFLFNFFNVLKKWYGKHWDDKSNVFLSSAGFVGAFDFLKLTLIPHCNLTNNFTNEHMADAMQLDSDSLIDREELKGKQGRASWNLVTELLKQRFSPKARAGRPKL